MMNNKRRKVNRSWNCYIEPTSTWDDEDKWWLSSETDRIINGVLYWADPSGPQK
jgi:hypothetical protein